MKEKKQILRCSLAIIIGGVVSSLLILLGLIITFYSYDTYKRETLQFTENVFELNSIYTEEKLSGMIDSVKNFVTVSSALQNLGVGGPGEFFILLPYFRQSFLTIPWMESFYVGYSDGSFSMIQAIRDNEQIRQAVLAPKNAAYSVKTIPSGTDKNKQVAFSYFDSELTFLDKKTLDSETFDPRKRGWYRDASSQQKVVVTEPYIFFTTREVGITTAYPLQAGAGVVGADSVLTTIADFLREQKLTNSTQIVLMDAQGRVVLSASKSDLQKNEEFLKRSENRSLHVTDLDNQAMHNLFEKFVVAKDEGSHVLEVDGRRWFGQVNQVNDETEGGLYLAIASPFEELLVTVRTARKRSLIIIFSVVFAALLLGIYLSSRIAGSLRDLSRQAENVKDFRLETPLTIHSRIYEVDQLAASMTVMQRAINRFVEIARALSAEKNMDRVLEMIVKEAQSVARADGGGIGLVSDDGKRFSYVLIRNTQSDILLKGNEIPLKEIAIGEEDAGGESLEETVIRSAQTRVINDLFAFSGETPLSIMELHKSYGYECHSLLLIPLLNRQDEVIGLLHLVNARDDSNQIIDFSDEKMSYIKALASNAALALDNNRLIRAQKDLFDSFVRLIAGAIDTKSPYTGGHCQRVPVLAAMLAEAASVTTGVPFKDFELSEEEQYELFVASWLHDCGKVTTPEYVVDKATKLETIYNRIHEVRTRFEVLWRDADIVFYKGLIANPDQEAVLKKTRNSRRGELQDDFAYLAECNVGGEFMAPEKIVRLREMGKQKWQRNFDNRIGLSGDEEARIDMNVSVPLPVEETLLADKQEHIFPRPDGEIPYGENPWNITMPVPDYRYNQGELYNLSIAKGTLTEEERYKINDHIVQTIEMLNTLPFPKEIRRVPDWAGNHHEKLDGSGYPRSLTADQLTVPERIMAVADIFEALTAADRPYKAPRSLSSCINIMSFMKKDGHICPDLFELLLTSGLYKEYAAKYMRPEQIDEVNVGKYLASDR